MRRVYILVYNSEFGTRDAVRSIIDAMPEIINWRYELPSSFFIVSEATADRLANRMRETTGERGRFIIAELSPGNRQGLLDPISWNFINTKSDPT